MEALERMTKLICEILRSSKVDGMYLYVAKHEGTKRVPEPLLERFGKAAAAMTLLVTPDRKLANADTATVLASIEEKGFYLQMPPEKEEYMQAINQANSKLQGL
jgi:uncharacterized protein YcgL (UPF0745 family)